MEFEEFERKVRSTISLLENFRGLNEIPGEIMISATLGYLACLSCSMKVSNADFKVGLSDCLKTFENISRDGK